MVRALHGQLSVTATECQPGGAGADVDVWLYLLVGALRPGDRARLERVPADRTVVVANKCDIPGVGSRTRGSHLLGGLRSVSGLWGAADISGADAAVLRQWAAAGVEVPAAVAEFVAADRSCTDMLTRLDAPAVRSCLSEIASGRNPGTPETLSAHLHRNSGVARLAEDFRMRAPAVRAFRTDRLSTELSIVAATASGAVADDIEAFLGTSGREVSW